MSAGVAQVDSSGAQKGWTSVALGEVIELISGQHIKADHYNAKQIGLPYLTGPSDFGDRHPTVSRWTKHPKKSAIKGDVLLTVKGSGVGKINVLDIDEAVISRQIMAVRPKKIDRQYLVLIMEAHSGYFRSLATGAAIPGISREDVMSLQVRLPSATEQKRIVASLDQAFAALDRARAHAEANLANTDGLFLQVASESLNRIIQDSGTSAVGEIAEHCLGKMLDKKKNKGVMRPYLRNLNVRWFNVDTSDVREMRIEDHEAERYKVRRGDLLICEGGYPGRAAIYDSDDTIYFQKALHRVRFDDPNLSKVLMYWLYVEDRLGRLKSHFSGTGISHFTGKALAAYQMPVAAEDVTSDVVSRIDRCWADTRKLVSAYETKLGEISALRQSLLQQAFSGQLTL